MKYQGSIVHVVKDILHKLRMSLLCMCCCNTHGSMLIDMQKVKELLLYFVQFCILFLY